MTKSETLQQMTERLVDEFLHYYQIIPGKNLVLSADIFKEFQKYSSTKADVPFHITGVGRVLTKRFPRTKRIGGTYYMINVPMSEISQNDKT